MSIITKHELRRTILARVKSLSQEQLLMESRASIDEFLSSGLSEGISSILLYQPISGECNITPLFDYYLQLGIKVYLPRVDGNDIVIADMNDGVRAGAYGILEPIGQALAVMPDMVIVPHVAVTLSGERLGRGKGYYDRYLSNYTGITVGIALRSQVVEHIPCEIHDIKLQHVFCDIINQKYCSNEN